MYSMTIAVSIRITRERIFCDKVGPSSYEREDNRVFPILCTLFKIDPRVGINVSGVGFIPDSFMMIKNKNVKTTVFAYEIPRAPIRLSYINEQISEEALYMLFDIYYGFNLIWC